MKQHKLLLNPRTALRNGSQQMEPLAFVDSGTLQGVALQSCLEAKHAGRYNVRILAPVEGDAWAPRQVNLRGSFMGLFGEQGAHPLGYLHREGGGEEVSGITHWVVGDVGSQVSLLLGFWSVCLLFCRSRPVEKLGSQVTLRQRLYVVAHTIDKVAQDDGPNSGPTSETCWDLCNNLPAAS